MFAPLFSILAFACVPEPPNTSVSAEGEAPTASPPPVVRDVSAHAAELLEQKFGSSGEAAHVTSIVVEGGIIRLTLDLAIRTLGDSDVYSRICNALASLIGSSGEQGPIAGIQTFGPGGKPVVATASVDARCARFSP